MMGNRMARLSVRSGLRGSQPRPRSPMGPKTRSVMRDIPHPLLLCSRSAHSHSHSHSHITTTAHTRPFPPPPPIDAIVPLVRALAQHTHRERDCMNRSHLISTIDDPPNPRVPGQITRMNRPKKEGRLTLDKQGEGCVCVCVVHIYVSGVVKNQKKEEASHENREEGR